ncbi:hypothetical protein [Bacillus pseudomycoides]|uniref:hypothetical protein n=1 Tax=Bacillus pseudomycoides TaxID=64104 RepID=UPI000BEF4FE6|nr:hypothetical protein [Bacillus pseudomycoides]PEK70424.1 hypothetical protein CN593_05240 [Bacillus pseudomycoides]PEN08593.1 hypothetical protein CN640_13220 [Bacillus pseudomycoides]PFZ93733.1 hypothetical protein COL70_08950 [Bacillus pseudomycoides]
MSNLADVVRLLIALFLASIAICVVTNSKKLLIVTYVGIIIVFGTLAYIWGQSLISMPNLADFACSLISLLLASIAICVVTNPKKMPMVTYVGIGVIFFGILVYFLAYEN